MRAWERRCQTASETEEGRRESHRVEGWDSGVRSGEAIMCPASCSAFAFIECVNDRFAGDIDDMFGWEGVGCVGWVCWVWEMGDG